MNLKWFLCENEIPQEKIILFEEFIRLEFRLVNWGFEVSHQKFKIDLNLDNFCPLKTNLGQNYGFFFI